MFLWLINSLAGAVLVYLYIRRLNPPEENEAWYWFEENRNQNKRD